ncbi:penicillin acylase family protein [Litorilituus sediminis]|uniref:Penicillin acylase family protein n=1 Tax=Litorilituus sediminis TaxID=718192 RepID=A0A4P6P6Q2_9GAMM|nr:penicillin acylase family protein [Litorilituus sediminis]QBG37203.1 penicillin acylase family protein [Litorilituus sediminis]
MKYTKKIIIGLLLISSLVIATAATWFYSRVDSALPLLNTTRTVYGLSDTAIIERDELGIATIKAQNRIDIAIATGFVHAQERFFQMDLLRRNSAGELSSLFGEQAVNYDKSIRRHRFRDKARAIVAQLPLAQAELLKAYTRGVNQGLKFLRGVPFEYLLLQQEPVNWSEEDSMLAIFSMYIDLQYHDGKRERTLGLMKAVLSGDVYAFLNPKGSLWDAAIDGSQYQASPMPSSPWPAASAKVANNTSTMAQNRYQVSEFPGSNNWAVSGKLTQTGSAIVANDMHLGIRVPNTWYRASFEYPIDTKTIKVTGATLPGTPTMVVGSNGNIAWGFTNSYGDYSDIIQLELSNDGKRYKTPNGYKAFSYEKEIIAVKDQQAVEIDVQETIWGPVIGEDHQGNLLAYRWVAHDKEAVNLTGVELELAQTVTQAFDVAARSGIPAQNMMVGDKAGNIGWTIMGPLPKKVGEVGDTPSNWANGDNAWQGYLSPEEYPRVINPSHNRLWTANSRVVGGDMLTKIGNGGYALGARSKQIRDNLMALESVNEQALLDIGLDDRGLFLSRWQQFLLDEVLTEQAIANKPLFIEAKEILTKETTLAATTDSVAYRLVRNFRLNVRDSVFSQLNDTLTNLDDSFNFRSIRHQIETPLWQLVSQQPTNFLMRPEASWQALFEKALTQTIADMLISPDEEKQSLAQATWGQLNTTKIQHPLSRAVPILGYWLDMPSSALSGDTYMPKVQGKSFGASERMVVSPGFEEHGIFHMPTSQAGHPWSPYYGKGHQDWEQGKPSAFLPGKTRYTLTLNNY